MAARGYYWLGRDPPLGKLKSVFGYVCAFLLWCSYRTTPALLFGPISPSLLYGSVICHECIFHVYGKT